MPLRESTIVKFIKFHLKNNSKSLKFSLNYLTFICKGSLQTLNKPKQSTVNKNRQF